MPSSIDITASKPATAPPRKETKVELAKRRGDFLRGTIKPTLESEATAFGHDDVQLLKFHGVYQQDDRDARKVRRQTGVAPEHSFMVRTRIPGGRLSADQYLAFDSLAEKVAQMRSLRITTRQTFQFHGVVKSHLHETLAAINQTLVTTLAACGDVGRNVMVSPAPRYDPAHHAVLQIADDISRALTPSSQAYHEIWLDGEKLSTGDAEPLYGPQYLPRKLKVGIALPDDNAIDVHSQDIGLIAVVHERGPAFGGSTLRGVNVLTGGGFGMTHRKADTFARLGTPLGFTTPEHAVEAVRTIATIFRDHGNRGDRRHARLKYLIEDWGLERFRSVFRERADIPLAPPVDSGPLRYRDWLGAHEQGDGKLFYGIHVANGRLLDRPRTRLKSALRLAITTLRPSVILTPTQNLLLTDLDPNDIATLEAILAAHDVRPPRRLGGARRFAMACPALPTCGLALAEAERFQPQLLDQLETALIPLGLHDEPLSVRVTGCPNGCARPYTADIGIVGRRDGHYDVFVGGRLAGDRFAELWAENVASDAIVPVLHPLLSDWARYRLDHEGFGDYFRRTFGGATENKLTGAKHPLVEDHTHLDELDLARLRRSRLRQHQPTEHALAAGASRSAT